LGYVSKQQKDYHNVYGYTFTFQLDLKFLFYANGLCLTCFIHVYHLERLVDVGVTHD